MDELELGWFHFNSNVHSPTIQFLNRFSPRIESGDFARVQTLSMSP